MNQDHNDEVTNALRSLREASTGIEAPASLERTLLTALQRRRRRTRVRTVLWSAAAVAACFAGVLITSMRRDVPVPPPAVALSPTTGVSVEKAVQPPLKKTLVARSRRPRKRLPKADVEAAKREFVRVPYSPDLHEGEAAQVVRVRLPRSSLQPFGLPVSMERMFDRVDADLLMGQDGIVRAVRLVK